MQLTVRCQWPCLLGYLSIVVRLCSTTCCSRAWYIKVLVLELYITTTFIFMYVWSDCCPVEITVHLLSSPLSSKMTQLRVAMKWSYQLSEYMVNKWNMNCAHVGHSFWVIFSCAFRICGNLGNWNWPVKWILWNINRVSESSLNCDENWHHRVLSFNWDRWCWQMFGTVTMGLCPGRNSTMANVAVQEVNQPEVSTRIWFDGKLPTCLHWGDCQWVAQWVHQ